MLQILCNLALHQWLCVNSCFFSLLTLVIKLCCVREQKNILGCVVAAVSLAFKH